MFLFLLPLRSTSTQGFRLAWATVLLMALYGASYFQLRAFPIPAAETVMRDARQYWMEHPSLRPPFELSQRTGIVRDQIVEGGSSPQEAVEQQANLDTQVDRFLSVQHNGLLRRMAFIPSKGLVQRGLVTHPFLIFHWIPLAGLMLLLYFMAPLLERAVGSMAFLTLYVAGAATAVVTQTVVSADISNVAVFGPAGAIATLMGALVVNFFLEWVELGVVGWFLIWARRGGVRVPAVLLGLVWAVLEATPYLKGQTSRAHMLGQLAGFGFGFIGAGLVKLLRGEPRAVAPERRTTLETALPVSALQADDGLDEDTSVDEVDDDESDIHDEPTVPLGNPLRPEVTTSPILAAARPPAALRSRSLDFPLQATPVARRPTLAEIPVRTDPGTKRDLGGLAIFSAAAVQEPAFTRSLEPLRSTPSHPSVATVSTSSLPFEFPISHAVGPAPRPLTAAAPLPMPALEAPPMEHELPMLRSALESNDPTAHARAEQLLTEALSRNDRQKLAATLPLCALLDPLKLKPVMAFRLASEMDEGPLLLRSHAERYYAAAGKHPNAMAPRALVRAAELHMATAGDRLGIQGYLRDLERMAHVPPELARRVKSLQEEFEVSIEVDPPMLDPAPPRLTPAPPMEIPFEPSRPRRVPSILEMPVVTAAVPQQPGEPKIVRGKLIDVQDDILRVEGENGRQHSLSLRHVVAVGVGMMPKPTADAPKRSVVMTDLVVHPGHGSEGPGVVRLESTGLRLPALYPGLPPGEAYRKFLTHVLNRSGANTLSEMEAVMEGRYPRFENESALNASLYASVVPSQPLN